MGLYIVAIIEMPTKNEEENGVEAKLVLDPTPIIANSTEAAIAKASKFLPDTVNVSRIQVFVRPF